jgi:uncharacterized SAM-binding protein YcdF (DUF218 family)
MSEIKYFDPEYRASRKKILEELKEIVKKEPPKPEKNWGLIWVLTGPEYTFEDKPAEGEKFNQTKQRFLTGLEIARQVTALRLGKKPEEITIEDIEKFGPSIYYNGRKEHNEYLKRICEEKRLEKEFNFPSSKIIITSNENIKYTKDQFDDFSPDLVAKEDKVIIVSDLYHLPRVKLLCDKYEFKLPPEKFILYPSQPKSLPVGATLKEIRKIYPLQEKGELPKELPKGDK